MRFAAHRADLRGGQRVVASLDELEEELLVERQPVAGRLGVALGDHLGHGGEVVRGAPVGPAVLAVDPHGVVPVVERDQWLDPAPGHRGEDPVVEAQAGPGEHAAPRLDPRPVDRDPVRVGPQAGGQPDVRAIAREEVDGVAVRVLRLVDRVRAVVAPDVEVPVVVRGVALALERGAGDAPEEVPREGLDGRRRGHGRRGGDGQREGEERADLGHGHRVSRLRWMDVPSAAWPASSGCRPSPLS